MIKSYGTRVDKEFLKRLRKIISSRTQNFPNENIRELSDRELTRMLRNTDGFQKSLEELKIKPRKMWK